MTAWDLNRPALARANRRMRLGGTLLVGAALVLGACGASSKTTTAPTSLAPPTSPATTAAQGSGPVDVLYAGSLLDFMNDVVSAKFKADTGYTFVGTSGDSGDLANEIKGKTVQGDIYISANPSKDTGLEGTANGNWVTWYATFATSPLVLGYNPNSKFAQDIKTEPWYQAVSQPGFLLGRTDPTTDPKGVLAQTALEQAATADNLPGLKTLATEASDVFPENTLVGRLQAGQLDAGFFYGVEAASAKIVTVPIDGSALEAKYTITILTGAPHSAAATAFVAWLLGPQGAAALQSEGMTLNSPAPVSGTAPASLQGVLSGQ